MKDFLIPMRATPSERATFNSLLSEAGSLGEGVKGREVNLKAITTNEGTPSERNLIYLSVEGRNVGLQMADKEDKEEIFPLINGGCYKAFVTGVSNDGKNLLISVEETEEQQVQVADKNKIKSAKEQLESLLGKDELADRLSYMSKFGLVEKVYPTLYGEFLEKMAVIVEGVLKAGEPLPEKPSTLFISASKKDDGNNPLLSLARSWVIGRPTCLEGQKGLGKDVAFESFAWLTGCRLVTLQWHGRTTRGDAVCHETTDNSTKQKLSVEGLVEALNWFRGSVVSKLFKKDEEKAEKAASFLLNTIKSLSPSLKMENGPIMEALELAARGVGVILLNDEMNLGEPNFQTGTLNYLCDGHTPNIYIGGKGVVPICREYFFVGATQNGVGGDYVGTHKLNSALADRFKFIKMGRPASIRGILRTAGKTVDETVYDLIDNVYKEYSRGVESGEYPPASLSIRGMKGAIEDIYLGAEIKVAIAENINNGVQSDDDTDMLNTVVDALLP